MKITQFLIKLSITIISITGKNVYKYKFHKAVQTKLVKNKISYILVEERVLLKILTKKITRKEIRAALKFACLNFVFT